MFTLVEDPTKKIWYIAEKEVFKVPTFRPNLNVEQVGPDDIHLVQKCIDLFNSEIQWSGMFNVEEAKHRFQKNNLMFVLKENNNVLGHVWFDNNYLYNMFVSKKRIYGDSHDFCNHVCYHIGRDIRLYCVKDNIKGQKFFEKVGFLKI